jgi:hypothetical protein
MPMQISDNAHITSFNILLLLQKEQKRKDKKRKDSRLKTKNNKYGSDE